MNKFILIICFLMFILIGAVAADDNLTESQGNLSADDLKKEIDNAESNLSLDKNYTFNSSVSINKSIVIDGNNACINATTSYRIFNITGDNVTLENICFICKKSDNLNIIANDSDEGLFYWTGENGRIFNCTFIYRQYDDDVGTFSDLTDEINSAGDVLVLNRDYVYSNEYFIKEIYNAFIINSSLFDMSVVTAFSVIGSDEDGILINRSVVIDGNGHVLDGKGISRIFTVVNGSVIFKNIVFRCGSSTKGSAIYGESLVINSTFEDNYCRNNVRESIIINYSSPYGLLPEPFYCVPCYGGAIFNVNSTNCTFKNNHADYGGAMFGGTALNCIFENNYADYGGVMYVGNAINCTFRNNRGNCGGVMYEGNAAGCIFENNNAFDFGGALYKASAINSNFTNNSANCGGAICQGSCDGCIFIDNTACENGGAISSYRHHNNIFTGDKILNSVFINNYAGDSGGAVWGLRDYAFNASIINCTFKHNKASKNGGAVYAASISNSIFENNTAFEGGDVSDSVILINSSIDAYNTIFLLSSNNKTFSDLYNLINSSNQSEIYLNDNYTFDLSKDFIFSDGGINITRKVFVHGNNHIIDANNFSRIFNVFANSTFENICFKNARTSGNGGAINGECTVLNSKFLNNYAYENGGAVYNCSCFNSSFIENFGRYGGAISYSNASNSIFINNSAYYGGAVYHGIVYNSNFTFNNVDHEGGAIWYGDAFHCIFINNSAVFGGAIDHGFADHSVFISNFATYSGAAISGGSAFNCSFINNTALESGGAVYIFLKNSTIIKCYFENNTANKKGGAIYIDAENVLVNNSIFTNNNAKFGKDFYSESNSSKVLNSTYDSVNPSIFNDTVKITNIDLIIYFKSSISVKVYRGDKAVISKFVKFTIGKDVFNVKTDKNGVASLKIKKVPGKYSIVTEFEDVKVKDNIVVKSRLITKNLSKKVKKSAKFNVKVLDTNGKTYAKQTVKINFKGKTYKVKTNSKGIATFKLGKNIKKGKYTIKTTYTGLVNVNKVIVKK